MSYFIWQIDNVGRVLSDDQVDAHDYNGALRQLDRVSEGAERIEVYTDSGKRAGEISVEFWRRKIRRR